MISQEQIEKALDFIRDNAGLIAEAKANRIYLTEYRKSLKGLLFHQSPESAVAAKIEWAYAHTDYQALLKTLQIAVEIEEKLRWEMVAAQAKVEAWRSQEASNRLTDRSHQ